MNHGIVLFDGVCDLCDASVRFVLKRDAGAYFRFASLQSARGRQLLVEHGLPPDQATSVVLIEGGQVFQRSDAALRIARRLSGLWAWLWTLRFVPRSVRDGVYAWIAANRYRWFGQHDLCEIPAPEFRDRFLS